MPRTSYCPTCDTKVKVPDTAKRGSLVRCPSCEETFQPPFLKPVQVVDEEEEEYDPETAETFGVGGVRGKNAGKEYEEETRRKAREDRRRAGSPKYKSGLFDNPDVFWLLLAAGFAGLVAVGWLGMRFRDNPKAAAAVVPFILSVIFVGFALWFIFRDWNNRPWKRF